MVPLRGLRAYAVALVALTTFTDLVAYSIAVPVLPDLGRQYGASPTLIGLLFASFGLTVLAVSVPMGAVSDRGGRKRPLVAGAFGLLVSTLIFAYADSMTWLFAARLVQGAADAVTWVVGFALIADLYGPAERGRVMGIVMAASTFGFMAGPTLGGWLYEAGGIKLPFLFVAALAAIATIGLALVPIAATAPASNRPPMRAVFRAPEVRRCALAVVVAAGTIAMIEPVLSLHLASEIQLGPARVGLVFGLAAIATALLHPLFGRLADRLGGRTVTFAGLFAVAFALPLFGLVRSFETAAAVNVVQAIAVAMVVTPSLAYIAEAISPLGVESFGVAYGVYNFAWALGLLVGPALGGFLYERIGLHSLALGWALFVLVTALALVRGSKPSATL
jgi:MFS transporter, DHA1 family, solute carrier family 18 (vesicular amine transporter), member 1/2